MIHFPSFQHCRLSDVAQQSRLTPPPIQSHKHTIKTFYLQGQQSVAVAVGAKHVLFYPGFRPQWSSGTWEFGWSNDVARKGLLQGRGVADRPGYTHPAPSAVVPAPGHAPGTPAIALVAAPGRRFHHGLRRHRQGGWGHTGRKGKKTDHGVKLCILWLMIPVILSDLSARQPTAKLDLLLQRVDR